MKIFDKATYLKVGGNANFTWPQKCDGKSVDECRDMGYIIHESWVKEVPEPKDNIVVSLTRDTWEPLGKFLAALSLVMRRYADGWFTDKGVILWLEANLPASGAVVEFSKEGDINSIKLGDTTIDVTYS